MFFFLSSFFDQDHFGFQLVQVLLRDAVLHHLQSHKLSDFAVLGGEFPDRSAIV